MDPAPPPPRRRHKTRWTVGLADTLSRVVITVGGIGTILALLLVCAFLIAVAAPLFRSAKVKDGAELPAAWKEGAGPLAVAVDEHQRLGWALLPGGELYAFR